ncbi:hypothetical protein EOK75_02490 [Pseudorhodobacter turbinis]|uniref:DUF1440 domain-containing protein n=1 Tax=Pseudorhodobacter turbinis TaxID=2500533 RepID=A0A4P8ED98_9RHOB|nr:hypothetical protein [Pseudorhodobacter turbinis]QCO54756.1 hypothetical protein EOK75_02490 [Pseudorhodobacter turbinis]
MLTYPTLRNLAIAGLAGEIAFELYAWLISPLLFGVALAPANLVVALTKIGFGVTLPYWAGFILHFTIGIFGFAGFVWLTHLVSRTKLVLSGAIAGFVLWFVAQGILAPLVGRTFMMGFGAYTQSSFIGHVGMATLIGYVVLLLQNRQAATAT